MEMISNATYATWKENYDSFTKHRMVMYIVLCIIFAVIFLRALRQLCCLCCSILFGLIHWITTSKSKEQQDLEKEIAIVKLKIELAGLTTDYNNLEKAKEGTHVQLVESRVPGSASPRGAC